MDTVEMSASTFEVDFETRKNFGIYSDLEIQDIEIEQAAELTDYIESS